MKRVISFLAAAVILLSTVGGVYADGYKTSDWAADEIGKAFDMGLVPARLSEADLTSPITREEFASVAVKLYEAFGEEKAETTGIKPFSDTSDEDVLKAYAICITTGVSDTEFAPTALLSREQAAVMLARVFKKLCFAGWTIERDPGYEFTYIGIKDFSDDEKISAWAKDSVYFMADNGIIKGISDTEFAPRNITPEDIASGKANATREAAVLMAKRMAEFLKTRDNSDFSDLLDNKAEENTAKAFDPDPYQDIHDAPDAAADENVYTMAFIGGSLTEGGLTWINAARDVIGEIMPDKEVKIINAGKGGTGSDYGAARFMEDVGKYSPDAVFVEFAVNDRGRSETESKVYMESIVRQALRLPKIPAVVFIYAPIPYDKDTDEYKTWAAGVGQKEEIAKNYGIRSVNIYDYMYEDYEAVKAEKGYESFIDYLSKYYNGNDVHGGYTKYAEAIEAAVKNDPEGFMTVPENAPVFCAEQKSLVDASYKYIMSTSGRMHYAAQWDTYTAKYPFETDEQKIAIPNNHYYYPYFQNGIKQAMDHTAAFGFMTEAAAFCINHTSTGAESEAKVYIDGTQVDKVSVNSQYLGVNYITKWISLPNDGKEHKVILVVDSPSGDKNVFRFGSVIERYEK